ncbi:MAG: hypothetical protein ACLTCQ_12310 [Enterocloster bolteae]
MSLRQEETDIYIIPPNFIESGTIMGGTLKLRNAVEALCISLLVGIPEFYLPFSLTTKIIIACVTVLPLALFAIIGINGESLTSFVINFFLYLKHRRIVGICPEAAEEESASEKQTDTVSGKKAKKKSKQKRKLPKIFRMNSAAIKNAKLQKERKRATLTVPVTVRNRPFLC